MGRHFRHSGTPLLAAENFVVPAGPFRGLTLGEALDRLSLTAAVAEADRTAAVVSWFYRRVLLVRHGRIQRRARRLLAVAGRSS